MFLLIKYTLENRFRFNPTSDAEKNSNMVILEVSMPSGFVADKEKLDLLLKTKGIKLVEMKKGETVIDIYIEQMLPNVEWCVDVQGYRLHKVAENKPVPVRIYDYYDSCKCFSTFYFLCCFA